MHLFGIIPAIFWRQWKEKVKKNKKLKKKSRLVVKDANAIIMWQKKKKNHGHCFSFVAENKHFDELDYSLHYNI